MKDNKESALLLKEEVILEIHLLQRKFTYREIAALKGVSTGVISRIIKIGKLPTRPDICLKLGIPAMGEAHICPEHGYVHERICHKQYKRKPREKKYTLKQVLMAVEYGHKTNLNLEDTLLNVRQLLVDL